MGGKSVDNHFVSFLQVLVVAVLLVAACVSLLLVILATQGNMDTLHLIKLNLNCTLILVY